jgi:hypothetical protein
MKRTLQATAILGAIALAGLIACPSWAAAIKAAPDTLTGILEKANPGDTILLADGTYKGDAWMKRSGTPEAPITLKAESTGAVFDGGKTCLQVEGANWVVVDGIRFQNAEVAGMKVRMGDLANAEHITIRNCTFANNKSWGIITSHINFFTIDNCESFGTQIEHGIYFANSGDDAIIRNNRVHNNAGNGIHMNGDPEMGGDGIVSRALVEANFVWGNGLKGGSGVNCTHVQDSLYRNNLLWANHAGGFTFYYDTGGEAHASKRNQVYNNTVYFSPDEGKFGLVLRKTSTGCTVENNVFFGGARGAMYVTPDSIDGLKSDYNVVANHEGQLLFGDKSDNDAQGAVKEWKALGVEAVFDGKEGVEVPMAEWRKKGFDKNSALGKAPHFADIEVGDFRLREDSVGIDMGTPLPKLVPTDIDGTPRPQRKAYDCGCYEIKPVLGLGPVEEPKK